MACSTGITKAVDRLTKGKGYYQLTDNNKFIEVLRVGSFQNSQVAYSKAQDLAKALNKAINTGRNIGPVFYAHAYSDRIGVDIIPTNAQLAYLNAEEETEALRLDAERSVKERETELGIDEFGDSNPLLLQIDDRVTNIPVATPKTLQRVNEFLKRVGVTAKSVADITINGKRLNANGVALPLQSLIMYVGGKGDIALTEESMHIAVELLSQKNPSLYNELIDKVTSYPLYKQVYSIYSQDPLYQNNGRPDINKIKKEAVGKLLTQTVIDQQNQPVITKWWNKVVDFFKGLFGIETSEELDLATQAVEFIFTEDLGTIRDTLLKSETYLKDQGFTSEQIDQVIELANSNITNDELKIAMSDLLPDFAFLSLSSEMEAQFNTIKNKEAEITISSDGQEGQFQGKKTRNTLLTIAERTVKSKLSPLTQKYKQIMRDIRDNPTSKTHQQVQDIFKRYIDTNGELLPSQKRKAPSSLLNDPNYSTIENEVVNTLDGFPPGTKFLTNAKIHSTRNDVAGEVDIIAITPDNKVNVLMFQQTTLEQGQNMDNIQRQAYKDMIDTVRNTLKNDYGVAQFGLTRVIPINKLEDNGVEIIEVAGKTYSNQTQNYLYPIPSDLESTGSRELDSILDKVRVLYQKFHNPRDKSLDQGRMDSILNGLIKSARDLQVKKDIGEFRRQIPRIAVKMEELIDEYKTDWVKRNLAKEKMPDINKYLNQVYIIYQITETLQNLDINLSGFLTDESDIKAMDRSLGKIRINIKGLQDTMYNFGNQLAIEREGIKGIVDKETIRGWGSNTMRGLSQSNIAAAELLGRLTNIATGRADLRRSEYIKTLKPLQKRVTEWATQNGVSFSNILDPITQKDASGRYVHKLIEKFSPEFYEGVVKARETNDNKWVKDNINLPAYNKSFQEFKDRETILITESVEASYEWLTQAERDDIIEKRLSERVDKFDLSLGVHTDNTRLKNFPKQQYSKEYQNLLQPKNAPMLDLYNHISALNNRSNELGVLDDFRSRTFLPFSRKSLLESITFGGAAYIPQNILSEIAITEEESDFVNRDAISGEIRKKVPFYMLYDISKKRVDPATGEEYRDYQNISTNIFTLLDLYNLQIEKYDALTEVETAIQTVAVITRTKEALPTTQMGEASPAEGSAVDNKLNSNYLDNLIDLQLYGRRNTGVAVDKNLGRFNNRLTKFINKATGDQTVGEEGERVVSAANVADQAKRWFTMKTLGLKLAAAIPSLIGTSIQGHIEAGKFYSKNEWWNIWGRVVGGKIGTKMGASKENNTLVGLIDYVMVLNSGENNRETARQLSLNKVATFSFNNFFMTFLNLADRPALYTNAGAYLLNTMVVDGQFVNIREFVNQKTDWLSQPTQELRNAARAAAEQEIKTLKETQALDKIATWEKGPDGESYLAIPGIDRTSEAVVRLRDRLQKLGSNATGMSDDMRGGQGNPLFRMAMTFKSWMPRLLSRRFDDLRKTPGTSTTEYADYDWGRYRVFMNYLGKVMESKGSLALNLLNNSDAGINRLKQEYEAKRIEYKAKTGKTLEMTEQQFVELYQQQVKAAFVEFAYLGALFATMLSLAALAPDDDDDSLEAKNFFNYTLKIMDKSVDEMLFFINPKELYKLGNGGIVPPIGIINDVLKVSSHLRKEAWGQITDNNELIESAKPTKYILKSLPLGGSVVLPIMSFANADLARELGYKEELPRDDR